MRPSPHRSRRMPDLWITSAETDREILEFIQFPWKVYRNDAYWVPPLISERRTFLNRAKNPFFQHGRAEYFLARRDGRVVGTIDAFTNDLYNAFQRVNTGFFGFFEVLDDSEAARAL